MKKTFGRFQLEAPRAYKCKQILGLCQALLQHSISVFEYSDEMTNHLHYQLSTSKLKYFEDRQDNFVLYAELRWHRICAEPISLYQCLSRVQLLRVTILFFSPSLPRYSFFCVPQDSGNVPNKSVFLRKRNEVSSNKNNETKH